MRPVAQLYPDGRRLHLQHGPIDLIISADGPGGAREIAFAAAQARFETVLDELVPELPMLRRAMTPDAPLPDTEIARQMDRAVRPFAGGFITRMAAVAGAVADIILRTMNHAAPLTRAYVNNGGDIALHLTPGALFTSAMQDYTARDLGRVTLSHGQGVHGIATSGRHGRSLSFGIADSVTVLAATAANADAAATLIANAVDLADHPAIQRRPANQIDPDSDLGTRPVVTSCAKLTPAEAAAALHNGLKTAWQMQRDGHILGAALFLNGEARCLGDAIQLATGTTPKRSLAYA